MTAGAFHFSSLYSSSKECKKKSRKNESPKKCIDSIITESEEVDKLNEPENKINEKRCKRKKRSTIESLDDYEEVSQPQEKLKKKEKKKNTTAPDSVDTQSGDQTVAKEVSACSDSETENQHIQEHQKKRTIPNTKLTKKKNGKKTKKGLTVSGITAEDREGCVLVEDLPVSVLLSYKYLLTKHFSKCGLNVKNIGVAELYPAAEPRAVFTTCVQFDGPAAAQRALLEDGARVKGARGVRVHVQPVSPATRTTAVVRCRAGCSPGLLSSVFAPCGRVRVIREVIKGNNSTPLAFVEFSGPEGVERALAAAGEARIGGAKVRVSRYEEHPKRSHRQSEVNDQDSS